MPDLRDRLRAALSQPARMPPAPRAESVTALRDLSALGGAWFESPHGPGYVIESVYEAGWAHGDVVLHRALSLDPGRLGGQVREPRLAALHPRDFLYIDTETTGLGGAGAMVFLAGTARFDGTLLRLRQYVLPSPEFEGGLLGGLAEDLERAGALVSYNGKSFDLPMLETRYILSRTRPAFRQLPHLDLLHPNRRLFRGQFDSHRLVRLEAELLGFEREADCPSSEVPERYFRFQRTGDPTWILPVLRHNAWDILSLVALAAHLAAVCDGHEGDLQAARAAEYAGDFAAALTHSAAALTRNPARADRVEALDVSDAASVAALATRLDGEAIDILVNNAGANWAAPMAEFPDEAFDKVMNTNVKGVFHLTRLLVDSLAAGAREGDPARVINIGSVDGLQAPALDTFAYSASKAAVHHMTRVLAHKLAPRRITVNAIAPGPFESKMMAETLRRAGDAIARANPMGRIGEPEDMAGTAIFLSSRASAYITGTVIPVDGGSSTRHQ